MPVMERVPLKKCLGPPQLLANPEDMAEDSCVCLLQVLS